MGAKGIRTGRPRSRPRVSGVAPAGDLYRALFEHGVDAVLITRPDGTILRANAAACRAFGLPEEELRREGRSGLVVEDEALRTFLAARERTGTATGELHVRHADGSTRCVEASSSVILDEGGERATYLVFKDVTAARRAQRELRESQERFAAIHDRAPFAIVLSSRPENLIVSVNDTALALFEYAREEVVGSTVVDLGITDARCRHHLAREVARRGRVRDLECECVTRSGKRRVLLVNAEVVRLGGREYLLKTAQDITARKHAERALRESEEKLRLLADAMPQIVCVLGPDGVPEYVNRSWQAYSGLDLPATRRLGWEQALHPDDLAAAQECRRRALRSLSPEGVELRYRGADGAYRWFLSRLAPVVEGRRVVRLVGAAMAIEARKAAEETLRAKLALKDQLSKVAASVPGVVCSFRLDPGGGMAMPFSAPGIADLYGVAQEELARTMAPVFSRVHREDAERVRREIAASAAGLDAWRGEFRYEHPTKGWRWIRGTSIPTREPDGATVWHGYVSDVTDEKDAEAALRAANERLRDADRNKDEFLGMLSHELRSPLAPIRQSLYLLRRAGADRADAHLGVIERQVEHLTRLVDDLLDVNRIARAKVQLRKERLDLGDLARRTAEDFRARIEERRVTLHVAVPGAPVWVEGDETRLAQVVSNLLHNASKFTRAGDQVTLSLETGGGAAWLQVRDTGAGIDPAMLGDVFDPFVQADRTRARTEGGLGLGLALVKGLVELHGGRVRADSAGKGKGTTFTVELPLGAPAPAREPPPHPDRPAPAAARHVLVVDDNRDSADTLVEFAAVLGHHAQVAYDATSALEKVRQRLPDVVLCDIGLPGIDGYEFARRIRASAGDRVRLIAVSGYAQPDDVDRALQAGFDAHIAKPPDPDRIAELLA